MKSHPLFLLSLLLVAVLMTISNIQGAIDLLPVSVSGSGNDRNPMDGGVLEQAKLLSPFASKRDFVVGSATNSVNPGATNNITASSSWLARGRPRIMSTLNEVPNDDNTVISIISMGRLVEKYVLERCVRSIRVRGAFSGYIIVFVDRTGFELYQKSMSWDPKTKIILGWEQDLLPMKNATRATLKNQSSGASTIPIEYAQKTMIFKRFKTHHAKYIAADPALAAVNIRYVLYVDVDIIVANPLSNFFGDYIEMVQREYSRWTSNLLVDNLPLEFGFFSLFVDRHLKGKMHTGIILSDLLFQNRCVDSWRKEMDEYYHNSDQVMLLNVIGNYSAYRCKTFELPPQHFNFANKRLMQERRPSRIPTFVHITEFRIRRMKDSDVHQSFLRFILNVKKDEEMVDGLIWEQVLSPTASRSF